MKKLLVLIIFAAFITVAAGRAMAHDANYTGVISGVGSGSAVTLTHDETGQDEWAGWVNVTITNNGSEAWGDFHFSIFEVDIPGYSGNLDVTNVDWVTAGYAPNISGYTLDYFDVDNDAYGATIDLYFYSNPVAVGETATFSVYNVNPDHIGFFGISFYPTPVPVPGAVWLLGSGLLGIAGLRKRFRTRC